MLRRFLLPGLALLVALSFLALDSQQRWRAIAFSNDAFIRFDQITPERDAASSTGYRDGQRTQILPYYVDCYNWIQQTQKMMAEHSVKVRHVAYDRLPDGREVHWSSSYRWWLGLLTYCDSKLNGTSLPIAVERVAPWASPIMLALALCGIAFVTFWRVGPVASALVTLFTVAVFDIYQHFVIGNADHHGLATLCVFGTVFCLVGAGAGWVRDESASQSSDFSEWVLTVSTARSWFIASAICGGVGLWISAATIVPVLLGIGVGGVLSTGVLARRWATSRFSVSDAERRRLEICRVEPRLWRDWGIAGAITSTVFYAVEYLPCDAGWRLEVNHPLYALAWFGGGVLVWLGSEWIATGRPSKSRWVWWLVGFASLAVLPITILGSWQKTFWVADPFLWALHERFINEFQPLAGYLQRESLKTVVASVSLLPLIAVPIGFLLKDRRIALPLRGTLALVLAAGLVMTVLGVKQIRWLGMADAVWLAGAASVGCVVWQRGSGFQWSPLRWIVAGVLLIGVASPHLLQARRAWFRPAEPVAADYFQAVVRDVSSWLRQRNGSKPVAILSGPTVGSMLAYFGGFRVQGSLYWENVDGLKDAAAIFSAEDGAEARRLLAERGISYIVTVSWDAFDEEYSWLAHGATGTDAPAGFMSQIVRTRQLPKWLRPVPYPSHELPPVQMPRKFFVGIFEVVPEQSDAEAGVRNAQLLLERADVDSAYRHLRVALSSDPDYLPAIILSARFPEAKRDAIRARVLRDPAALASLAWGDQIEAALLLADSPDEAMARRLLSSCWSAATEDNLRQLRPGACFGLIDASRRLQIEAPRTWRVFAIQLLPRSIRARLHFEDAVAAHLRGDLEDAANAYRSAIELDHNYTSALNNLAFIRAVANDSRLRNGAEAVEFARRASRATGYSDAGSLDTLACAYAEQGDFRMAVLLANRASKTAIANGNRSLAGKVERRLRDFEAKRPYRE